MHIELVRQNVVICTQVLQLTQCSLQLNVERLRFITLIMGMKLRQMQFCCPIRRLGSIPPHVIMICHLSEHQSP